MKIINLLILAIFLLGYFSSSAYAKCKLGQENFACCRKPVAFPTAPYTKIGGGCTYTKAESTVYCQLLPGDGIRMEWKESGCDHLNPASPSSLSGKFVILNTHGCPDGSRCNADLSWKYKAAPSIETPHPVAVLDKDDPVIWKITPIDGKPSHYTIRNTHGCPDGSRCNADLSWKYKAAPSIETLHPVAVLDKDDPVVWLIIQSK